MPLILLMQSDCPLLYQVIQMGQVNTSTLNLLKDLFGTETALYTPGAVANWFVQKSINLQKPIDHMQLQKLMYFAHGYCLARHDRPLVGEPVEAWRFGPVFPSVYHEYKKFGSQTIPMGELGFMREPVFSGEPKRLSFLVKKVDGNDSQTQHLLEEVFQIYSKFNGLKLSDMTHEDHPENPWRIMRRFMVERGMQSIDIPNTFIKNYFLFLDKEGKIC